MPQHTTPRQPLSCENCRKRKIKCQNSSCKVPCETCVRRGYSQSCFYKSVASASDRGSNESELLYRIRNLEDLLKQQIAQSSQSPPEHRTGNTPTRSDDASSYAESNVAFPRPRAQQCGNIIISPAGYQLFSLRAPTLDISLVNELADSAPSPLCTTSFPFSPDSVSSKSALLDTLPPLRQCDELKCVFFEVFSPLFHVLHDPTFETVYDRFRQNPCTVPLSWLALLFVILSLAITTLDEDHPLLRDLGHESSAIANIKKLSARYRSVAMQCLTADQFLHQHNLQTVQTLVLLIYAMNHANVSSWALLGMTFNIAVRIGCHVDPSRLGLGVIEGEERRRCWAALMMLYTVQNTCLGNIAPQNITADVELPMDMDDECLINSPSNTVEATGKSRAPSKMSYILYKFRLYKIAADICQCAMDEQLADTRVVVELDRKLANEDEEHTLRFSGENLPIYHIAHHYILQIYTHHLYLVLHRASLHLQADTDDLAALSRQRCKMSAVTILEAHRILYETSEFRPYGWYLRGLGSFHAFLAASILIVLANATTSTEDDRPRLHEYIEACVCRFENMADRSDICARSMEILRRVLRKSNQATAMQPTLATNEIAILPGRNLYQYPTNPDSDSEQIPMSTYDWTSNPELEALLFDMAPQQWMAPSSFTWDRWSKNVAFV